MLSEVGHHIFVQRLSKVSNNILHVLNVPPYINEVMNFTLQQLPKFVNDIDFQRCAYVLFYVGLLTFNFICFTF